MHIKFVEIANFRKLLSVRIDLSEKTTLFVGANNSGKTSAMLALRKFLSPQGETFETHDFTVCHWHAIDLIGQSWLDAHSKGKATELVVAQWSRLVPTLDLWLQVDVGEVHYVRDLIPTLDWEGGLIGVRLRFQPKQLDSLFKDFINSFERAEALRNDARASRQRAAEEVERDVTDRKLTLWPTSLVDFLRRKLKTHFALRAYTLDPAGIQAPRRGQARPQELKEGTLPIEGDPLSGLILVNEIPAQRGFGEARSPSDDEAVSNQGGSARLSIQLRDYYKKHLDPTEQPDRHDLGALKAIEAAQDAFDERLKESFSAPFSEVEQMGYPGVTDPRPRVSTRLKATDGLKHSAAVSFEVDMMAKASGTPPPLRLPENNNGLGYQNLISMIFRLLSFRDGWMKVGKAGSNQDSISIEPLHLILVEEPEAHLHAQVQQVFIRKAYSVLRAHGDLGKNEQLWTQLVVSTHSSHVSHEASFSQLRYFRRLPAGMCAQVPVSAVVNLSEVFGGGQNTERFVTRYLRARHADLFFADAAVLVEGPTERMLLPNFIRAKHEFLNHCYLTVLEIGGSHAHRLRELIEALGLLTLVVTDIDSLSANGGDSVQPAPSKNQVTANATLKNWLPNLTVIDELYAADANKKTMDHDQLFAVRIVYQTPLTVTVSKSGEAETVYPYTFEDAFVFENLGFFGGLQGSGLISKFRNAIANEATAAKVGEKMYKALRTGKKAEFALDVIGMDAFDSLTVPRYIAEGLEWLEERLHKKQVDVLASGDQVKPLDGADAREAASSPEEQVETETSSSVQTATRTQIGKANGSGVAK